MLPARAATIAPVSPGYWATTMPRGAVEGHSGDVFRAAAVLAGLAVVAGVVAVVRLERAQLEKGDVSQRAGRLAEPVLGAGRGEHDVARPQGHGLVVADQPTGTACGAGAWVDGVIEYANAGTTDLLRAHAGKVEQNERPAGEGLAALREDGVFAWRTPREQGGEWADVETIARRLTGLGRACPSTAWVAGTCVTSKNLAARTFTGSATPDFFADPDALFCGSGVDFRSRLHG
jgi:hypothetical protein